MSQAYQAPQVPAPKELEPALPIQRPSPKFLARRAVDRVRLSQSPQNQGIQSPQPTIEVAPAARLIMPPPQRIQIDWQARLREARQRLAMARVAREKAAAAKQLAVRRAASALTVPAPILRPSPVSRQSKFSRSMRRRVTTSPVIRVRGASVNRRLQVPARLRHYNQWPTTNNRRSPVRVAPRSGSQLYAQRLNALRSGQLYTRMPVDSFHDQWRRAQGHPSYWQWRELLALEARAAGRGKGANTLTAMVGDSLSQWFPADRLPGRQIWLNQSISGDTTTGILKRLAVLRNAKPDTVYLMAGVNDLKRGATDQTILRNIHQIIRRLRQQHPQAQIVVQSILPTRSDRIPNARIVKLNPLIQALAQRHGVDYLDLHQQFRDWDGGLRADLTTDGIHLSPQGYQVWQAALQRMDQRLAQRPRTIAQAQAIRENL
ncbi:lysophospholipase [filamentous cyanobacterium LEGE 11480]|uniref:Lysophospholipase n=1 Tax=Romeriopsis navalis LEGE 11480 TaxID=2777977 RepID=A0A928VV38_9CYAN|nr:GDSL-type esterase/lipase family protein [Romeriopsis navalis]MBE9032604.1 lysophospholipase [Romeriopsis navalis LEGE 11480]